MAYLPRGGTVHTAIQPWRQQGKYYWLHLFSKWQKWMLFTLPVLLMQTDAPVMNSSGPASGTLYHKTNSSCKFLSLLFELHVGSIKCLSLVEIFSYFLNFHFFIYIYFSYLLPKKTRLIDFWSAYMIQGHRVAQSLVENEVEIS